MQMLPQQLHAMQMAQAAQQTQTSSCPSCGTPLSYPFGSMYIQCPTCNTAYNPQPAPLPPPPMQQQQQQQQQQQMAAQPPQAQPHAATNYVNCYGCGALLSHPPTSVTIQCPKCLIIMDTPANTQPQQRATQALNVLHVGNAGGGGGGGPGGGGGGGGGGRERGDGGGRDSSNKEALALRKKRKDPHAPKRASNAYMIFCKERRAQLKADRPDLPFGQLGKRLGEMWRSMGAEEKKAYEDRATGDRDRYKGEMSSYQSTAMMKGAQREHERDRGSGGGGAGGAGRDDGRSDDEEEGERRRRKGDSNGGGDGKKLKQSDGAAAAAGGGDFSHHGYHGSKQQDRSPDE